MTYAKTVLYFLILVGGTVLKIMGKDSDAIYLMAIGAMGFAYLSTF